MEREAGLVGGRDRTTSRSIFVDLYNSEPIFG